jgi:hypothetical protein
MIKGAGNSKDTASVCNRHKQPDSPSKPIALLDKSLAAKDQTRGYHDDDYVTANSLDRSTAESTKPESLSSSSPDQEIIGTQEDTPVRANGKRVLLESNTNRRRVKNAAVVGSLRSNKREKISAWKRFNLDSSSSSDDEEEIEKRIRENIAKKQRKG